MQRLTDARFFRGWVDRSDEDLIVMASEPDLPVDKGDEFQVEIAAQERRVAFRGKLTDRGFGEYHVRLLGDIQLFPTDEEVRIAVQTPTKCCLIGDGEIEGEILDISEAGMGIFIQQPVDRESKYFFQVESVVGRIAGEAEARYCRRLMTPPNTFRAGFRVTIPDRISRGRWAHLCDIAMHKPEIKQIAEPPLALKRKAGLHQKEPGAFDEN